MERLLAGSMATLFLFGCGQSGGAAPGGVTIPACGNTWAKSVTASLTVTHPSNDTYLVQASSLNGASGIKITIMYDPTVLTSPVITEGSAIVGAFMVTDTTIPGVIKIVVVSPTPFSGSGTIASIQFTTRGTAGTISVTSANMINLDGTPVFTGMSSSTIAVPAATISVPAAPIAVSDSSAAAPTNVVTACSP